MLKPQWNAVVCWIFVCGLTLGGCSGSTDDSSSSDPLQESPEKTPASPEKTPASPEKTPASPEKTSLPSAAEEAPAEADAIECGAWMFRVLAVETVDSFVDDSRKMTTGNVTTIRPKAPDHRLAVIKVSIEPLRSYTSEEKALVEGNSAGKAGMNFAAIYDSEMVVGSPCFHLAYGAEEGATVDLVLTQCDLMLADEGSVGGISVGQNIGLFFAKDDPIVGRLVFHYPTREKTILLSFLPNFAGKETKVARIGLAADGTMANVRYGSIAEMTKADR